MTLQEAHQQLSSRLTTLYDKREAGNIADLVMEKITGLQKIDRMLRKQQPIVAASQEILEKYTAGLLTHRPVQYVLEEGWFCGLKFFVDEQVLIPRPETEELVQWILEDRIAATNEGIVAAGSDSKAPSILDIGTGSGCIPIVLKKRLPRCPVFACDISAGALAVAKRNAAQHGTSIDFLQLDFLDSRQRELLPAARVIVSNPPYIPFSNKDSMATNVVAFEPHLALFVDGADPLLFYRALGSFVKEKAMQGPGGSLYAEVHEEMAGAVAALLHEEGLPGVTVRKDMQGKERMIKATW
jgi:release factor glutamine methyltransferase